MQREDNRPETLAGVYRKNPKGFTDLLEIAEDMELDPLVEPMRRAIREVDGADG